MEPHAGIVASVAIEQSELVDIPGGASPLLRDGGIQRRVIEVIGFEADPFAIAVEIVLVD